MITTAELTPVRDTYFNEADHDFIEDVTFEIRKDKGLALISMKSPHGDRCVCLNIDDLKEVIKLL